MQLNVRMAKMRDRVKFYQNVTQFAQIGGHVNDHPEEYRLYAAEMALLHNLTESMWAMQDEIDDLQAEIMNMIYGQGGDAQ